MRRILIFIIGTIFLSGCIVSKTSYRIKSGNIEHKYYSLSYSARASNIIYLTKENAKIKNKVFLVLEFPEYGIKSDSDVIGIETSIEGDNENKKKYQCPELLEDIYIIKNNKDKIKISKENFEYSYKKDPDTNFPGVHIYTNQKFTGPITLELGKVKINDVIYDIPPLHLQRYKESASWGLVDDFLMQGNVRNKPLYESGKWLDD